MTKVDLKVGKLLGYRTLKHGTAGTNGAVAGSKGLTAGLKGAKVGGKPTPR